MIIISCHHIITSSHCHPSHIYTHPHVVMFTYSLLHTMTHSLTPSQCHNITLLTQSHCHNITISHPHTTTLSPPDPGACGDYMVGVAPGGTPEACDEGPQGGACCTSDCKLRDGAVCRYRKSRSHVIVV